MFPSIVLNDKIKTKMTSTEPRDAKHEFYKDLSTIDKPKKFKKYGARSLKKHLKMIEADKSYIEPLLITKNIPTILK